MFFKKQLFKSKISQISISDYINTSVEQGQGYSCFLNSHMIYEHHKNKKFSNVLDEASFVLTDGVPILYTFNLFHGVKQKRIAGNDVIFSLVDKAEKERLKIFIIGSTDETLKKISDKLKAKEIEHATYSPPFMDIDQFDFEQQSIMINNFEADIVMVGLGCPKQEIWMNRMKDRIDAPMYGLGGALLLFAEIDSRAPKFIRILGMEWFYRLVLEPKRLFMRYLITNTYFCYLFIKEFWNKLIR